MNRLLRIQSKIRPLTCAVEAVKCQINKCSTESSAAIHIRNKRNMSKTEEDSVVMEGLAEVYQPSSVFYNPVQEFNRDLTIAAISEFCVDHFESEKKKEEAKKQEESCDEAMTGILGEESGGLTLEAGVHYPQGVKILEGLAASGLRSIRFAKEIPGVQSVMANDFDKTAVSYIERNIKHNQLEHLVQSNFGNAAMVMYEHMDYKDRFDVVDLDPYGSPCQFLDGALQCVRDGGLLCVTCTDMAVLCGNSPETCHSKYGCMSLRTKYCHELALRIILRAIESHANRYSRYIEPLISISADFYVRLFVKVFTSPKRVKESVTKLSMVYQCVGCGAYTLQPLAVKKTSTGGNCSYTPSGGPPVTERCEHCNSRHHLAGPFWSAPIHNVEFVERVLKRVEADPSRFGTAERIKGVLTVISEELVDVPFYQVADKMFSVVRSTVPSMKQFRSAILNAGYQVSMSHTAKNSIKTTAPMHVLWDIVRCWTKDNPVRQRHIEENTVVKTILSREPQLQASFEIHKDAVPKSQKDGLLRWQINPDKDWGPKPKARKGYVETVEERRLRGLEKEKAKREKRKAQESEIDLKQYDCKRNKDGKCDLGDACRYTHPAEADGESSDKVAVKDVKGGEPAAKTESSSDT